MKICTSVYMRLVHFFSFSRNYDQSRDYKKRNTRSYFFKVIVFYFTNVF